MAQKLDTIPLEMLVMYLANNFPDLQPGITTILEEPGIADDDAIQDIYHLMSRYQMRIMAGMIPRPTITPLLHCPESFPAEFKTRLASFRKIKPFH